MNFFKKIAKSVYGPEYYSELQSKQFSYSVKYFALFALIFVAIFVLRIGIFNVPKMDAAIKNLVPTVVNFFPEELEVTIRGGKLSTNVPEPYFIEMPESWENLPSEENVPNQFQSLENLIVIDTQSEANADNLKKYDTLLLITQNYFLNQGDRGNINIQSLSVIPDMDISKQVIADLAQKYSPYLKVLPVLFLILDFFIAIGVIVGNLLYLLLAALFIWLIAKVKKAEINYGKAYQMGLHLMTLPLLLSALFTIRFPLWFTTLLLILAVINIRKENPIPGKILAASASEVSTTNPAKNQDPTVQLNEKE